MAVLESNTYGWIVSHEIFIQNIYEKTNHLNETKSFYYNPALFDIRVPFVKSRRLENKNDECSENIVKKAYDSLFTLYKVPNTCFKVSEFQNNNSAKSLANSFYSQLTRLPGSKFVGGNSSQESLVCEINNELYLIPKNSLFYCNDVKNISEILNGKKFDFILMDPPWWNKYIRRKRKKDFKFGYEMVYDKNLTNIPVNSLLSDDGLVAIWCTNAPSHIKSILTELFPAWNLQFIFQWFWLKITKYGEPICGFSQTLKKQPFERIIFGIKKNSVRILPTPESDKIIMSVPSAIHSHKPPLSELIKPYLPEDPKCLELFARYLLPGWTSYGNEVLKLQHISLYLEKS